MIEVFSLLFLPIHTKQAAFSFTPGRVGTLFRALRWMFVVSWRIWQEGGAQVGYRTWNYLAPVDCFSYAISARTPGTHTGDGEVLLVSPYRRGPTHPDFELPFGVVGHFIAPLLGSQSPTQ